MLPRKYEIRHQHTPVGRLHVTATGTRPGVTTVLDKGGPVQPWLAEWKARIGEDEAERIRLDATDRGSALHAAIETHLTGEPQLIPPERFAFGPPDPDRIAAMFEKVRPALDHITTTLGVELNAEWFSPDVPLVGNGFAGSIDCIGRVDFGDGRGPVAAILDWKSSAKTKRLDRIGNYRMQVAAYRTAFQATYPELEEPLDDAVIVIVPESGGLQIVHIEGPELRLEELAFAKRLEAFYNSPEWMEFCPW